MTEHDTQKAIIDLLKIKGAVVTRINSGSMIAKSKDDRCYRVNLADKGTSDIIALYCGVYLAIEVKYGDNKATKEQADFLESVAAAGGVGLVAYDCEFVRKIILAIDDNKFRFPMTIWGLIESSYPNRLFVRGEE
jgi:hypothetical protein